jgi:hypothetical protein
MEARITKFRPTPEGYWTANVGGVPVCNRFGCWGTPPDEHGRWSEVKREHQARLAARLRSEKRKAVTA